MIVINVFRKLTKVTPDGMEAKSRASELLRRAHRVFNSQDADWIHGNDGFRFLFLGPICIDAERKWQRKQLIQPLWRCYDMISSTEISLHSVVHFMLSEMRQDAFCPSLCRLKIFMHLFEQI
jgi:hypothetical protein